MPLSSAATVTQSVPAGFAGIENSAAWLLYNLRTNIQLPLPLVHMYGSHVMQLMLMIPETVNHSKFCTATTDAASCLQQAMLY